MKLLLDENLSPTLVDQLAAEYPGSRHVDQVGLHGERDDRIWSFVRDHDYVLVSKDSDFRELASIHGAPPKVVWLMVGNAGTSAIRKLLLENRRRLERFVADTEEALLALARPEDEEI